ncbi:MAG: hypothetical protein ABIN97_01730 [Ginsengibacter sp.]
MPDTFYLRIKKDYAAAVIEDLIKLDAVEAIDEYDIELTPAHKAALDKELEAIKNDPDYLVKWNDVKHRFKKS